MEEASVILEILMIIFFGVSWPFNIIKAYRAKTAKGTSIIFIVVIALGYVAGIFGKLFAAAAYGDGYWTFLKTFAFVFYFINLAMVTAAIIIYARNKKLDAKTEKNDI